MTRRLFIATTLAACLSAGFAMAATYQDSIVLELQTAGYDHISVESTWLGRIRILATKGAEQREIVLNPRTGEVLRDLARIGVASKDSRTARKGAASSGSGSAGSSNSGSSADAYDEDEAEDPEKPEKAEDSDDEKSDSSEKDDD